MSDVEERFEEILNSGNFICTQEEFNLFSDCGYIFETGNRYITRKGSPINVTIIKQKSCNLDIDLSDVINVANVESIDKNTKRVYFMTQESLEKYTNKGLIIEKAGNKYFRIYDNELWLVIIM